MLKYKLSPLIQKTAKDLKHSPALVEAVINHQFDFIRKQVLDPDPNVIGLRLEDLGKFYWKQKSYMMAFSSIKRTRNSIPKELLDKFLAMRYPISQYSLQRKFKLRFGTWHWKEAHDWSKRTNNGSQINT